jgi:drug/metabolite transporter (DMT)-like permease
MTTSVRVGFALAIAYVLLSAARDVSVPQKPLPIYFLFGLAFLPTALVSAALVAIRPGLRPVRSHESIRYVVALNVTTLLGWVGYFQSLKLAAGPLLPASVVVGFMPLSLLLIERVWDRRQIGWGDLLAGVLVVSGIALIAYDHLERGTATSLDLVASLDWALLGSVFSAANNWLNGRLRPFKFGACAVFASRFWLLLVGTLFWAVWVEFEGIPTTPGNWTFAASLGVFGIAVPIFCLQGAIYRLGATVPTWMIPLHPVCVLLLQGIFTSVTGVASVGGFGLLGTLVVSVGILIGLTRPRRFLPSVATRV